MTEHIPNTAKIEDAVTTHYSRTNLGDTILEALAKAGADPEAPTLDDLAPVDEFHTAGRITTIKTLKMMPLSAGMHVLDAGFRRSLCQSCSGWRTAACRSASPDRAEFALYLFGLLSAVS